MSISQAINALRVKQSDVDAKLDKLRLSLDHHRADNPKAAEYFYEILSKHRAATVWLRELEKSLKL